MLRFCFNIHHLPEFWETVEKNRGRMETRVAYTSHNTSVIRDRKDWEGLACFGAIHRTFQTRDANDDWGPKSDEWQYYISSRSLNADELLHHARMEWGVESMHWLLDVHFGEDFCRIVDKNGQKNLNMLRKLALIIPKFPEALHQNRKNSVIILMYEAMSLIKSLV